MSRRQQRRAANGRSGPGQRATSPAAGAGNALARLRSPYVLVAAAAVVVLLGVVAVRVWPLGGAAPVAPGGADVTPVALPTFGANVPQNVIDSSAPDIATPTPGLAGPTAVVVTTGRRLRRLQADRLEFDFALAAHKLNLDNTLAAIRAAAERYDRDLSELKRTTRSRGTSRRRVLPGEGHCRRRALAKRFRCKTAEGHRRESRAARVRAH